MIEPKLETFLTICKTKNFTKAAELLNLTQPAVTKHINSLEDYYGVPLFVRRGRIIELTTEGKILFEYAKDMKSQTLVMERKIRNSYKLEKHYTIGATLTIGEYILPYILGKYKKSNPNIDITMQVHNTDTITKKLLNGEIDLGLVEGPFDKNKFYSKTLKEDELVFAVSPQNQLAKKSGIEMDEVLSSKLILREEGSGTRKVLEDKLANLGFHSSCLKPYMEIGSIGAIKSLVKLNLGTTVISKTAIQDEVNSKLLTIIPIKGVQIVRKLSFIYLKDSPKEFVDSFIEFSIKSFK